MNSMRAQYTLKKAISCLFVSVFLIGCGSTEVHQIFVREPSMIEHRDIEVYVSGSPPKRPYYDIAILQAIGHGSDADVEHVTHAIANRAGRLGCDAVVRVHVELGYARAHGTGVCVKWAQAAEVPAPPPPAPAPNPTTTEAPQPPPPPTDENGGTSI